MKRRLTDCDIWIDPWFRRLSIKEKVAWNFIKDRCENWGEWKQDKELLEIFLHEKIDINELLKKFNKDKQRIQILHNENWFLLDFITFQYYGKLTPKKGSDRPIIEALERLGNHHENIKKILALALVKGLRKKHDE